MAASEHEVAGLLARLLSLLHGHGSRHAIARLDEVIAELKGQRVMPHSSPSLETGVAKRDTVPSGEDAAPEICDSNGGSAVMEAHWSALSHSCVVVPSDIVPCSTDTSDIRRLSAANPYSKIDTAFVPGSLREHVLASRLRRGGSHSTRTASSLHRSWHVHINESGYPRIIHDGTSHALDTDVCLFLNQAIARREFDMFWMIVIVLNAVACGVQIEYHARIGESHWSFIPMQGCFVVLFALELVLRLVGLGFRNYLCGPQWAWGWFDVCIVSISTVDLGIMLTELEASLSSQGFQIMRLVRILRVAKLVRGVRFMRNLRLLITGMINSFVAAAWTLVALVGLMYMCAIVVMTVVVDDINSGQDYYVNAWGGLLRSMCTLLQIMSGDSWWSAVVTGIRNDHPGIEVFFIAYYAVTAYGLLNIITAIFVDQTLRVSQNDAELLRDKHLESTAALREFLTDIFGIMDANKSGRVSFQEFEQSIADDRLQFALDYIHLKHDEVVSLFMCFDQSQDGSVDLQAFVDGCMALKGHPTAAEFVMQGRTTTNMLETMYRLLKKSER